LNLGTGTMTSIGSVIKLLEELSGGIVVDTDQPVAGPMQFQCDMTTLNRLIDWKPEVGIEEGVRRTFNAMKHQLSKKLAHTS
jgi:nucleoside-diphosphate-sugar epimerase